jgi:hypothetical protein
MPFLRILLAVVGLTTLAGETLAQAPKVRIASARVGLPPGHRGAAPTAALHVCKFATWTPIYLECEVLEPVSGPAELVIETPDPDGLTTTLSLPIDFAATQPGSIVRSSDLPMFPYVRPAAGREITLTVRGADGTAISEPFRIRSLRPRDALTYVVLSLGNQLTGFELPVPATGATEQTQTGPLRGGRVELAAITDPSHLPDQWFGYDSADLVILGTGSTDFLQRIFGEGAGAKDLARREALLEWVRRGGRLVVTVGANADLVRKLPALQGILPAAIRESEPVRTVTVLPLYWAARQSSIQAGNLAAASGFPVANLAVDQRRPARVVIPPPVHQSEGFVPLAVQSGFGLGKITLIAFDLDRPPFSEFGSRAEFWDWVLREGGANRASIGDESRPRSATAAPTDDEDELAVALRKHLDTFEQVPVISFGWVAFLIVLYILLIGPAEYYFLRRVLRRPELTWLTFPIIVATVGLGVYLTADSLKGRDIRLNKVDVVEVVADFDEATDKPTGRVFGRSWVALFSPRIDTYTIGVRPAPEWTAPGETGGSLVGWVGGPRSGQGSLLRRGYAYHTDPAKHVMADALVDVPLPMWSTRSVTANWTAKLDPANPVVESRLEHPPGDPSRVIGTFVNRMPFPAIEDCVAFYAGQAYPLGTILSGQEVRLILDQGPPATQWIQDRSRLPDIFARVAGTARTPPTPGASRSPQEEAGALSDPLQLWGYLFHEAALRNEEGVIPRNASLRRLDQSWRLTPDNRGEVIVVGRVPALHGPAGALFGGADSASRIWLKGVPGSDPAPALTGFGRQETYIRLYLPIRPVEATAK